MLNIMDLENNDKIEFSIVYCVFNVIVTLMDDVLLLVFKRLSIWDIFNCKRVNKQFYRIINNKSLWKHLYLRDYADLDVVEDDHYKSYIAYIKLNNMVHQYLAFDMRKSINLQTELGIYHRTICYIPTILCLLKNLTKIYISHNDVRIIPTEIGYLKKLERLHLNHNDIRLIPTQIGLLTNLVDIVIDSNYIKCIPTEIGMLCNLESISMSMNAITEIPTQIGKLSKLINLSLNVNNITTIPTEVALLSDKIIINLSSNNIWEIPKELENKKMDVTGNFIATNKLVNIVKDFFNGIFG